MTSQENLDGLASRPVALEWSGVHDVHPEFVDQAAVGLGSPASPRLIPDSVVITLGRLQSPFLVGTPEQVARQMAAVGSVPIQAVGRFVMSRERAEELRDVLTVTLNQYDEMVKQRSGENP